MTNGTSAPQGKGVERRSGTERRTVPPTTCAVPCKPIDDKLQAIEKCVMSKTPQKLFFWAVGGIAAFVVLVIGGAQWKIVDSVSEIRTDVKVMQVTVEATKMGLDKHLMYAEGASAMIEKRLDALEMEVYKLQNGHKDQ